MLVVQNENRPGEIENALADLMRDGVETIRACCAYVTLSGSSVLFERISRAAPYGQGESVKKTIVTSLDYGLTDPRALKFWKGTTNCSVLVAGAELLAQGTLVPEVAFHPKFYIIGRPNGKAGTLVGSANLTNRGLTNNSEVGWLETEHDDKEELDRAWKAAIEVAVPLTNEILTKYSLLRRRASTNVQTREVSPVPAPYLGAVRQYAVLADAAADASGYRSMWIQSRGMQGGAGTQLELPRGAHRFFGATYEEYDFDRVARIAEPVLVSGRTTWTDRPLTWHGDNSMERINLPSRAMGGFEYRNSLILFRRIDRNTFELRAYDWDSDSARAYVDASRRLNLMFRLGRNSNRLTGFLP